MKNSDRYHTMLRYHVLRQGHRFVYSFCLKKNGILLKLSTENIKRL